MDRLRILQLVSGIAIGAEAGGGELHALRIARYLDRSQFESAVFAVWSTPSQLETTWRDHLQDWQIPLYGLTPAGSGLWRTWSELRRLVQSFQPQIVHSHSELTDTLNAGLRLVHPAGALAMRTMHINRRWETRPYLHALMEKRLFPRLFHHHFAVSQAILDLLQQHGISSQHSTLCYNGIDEAAFSPAFTAQHTLAAPLPGRPPYVGVIGRLTHQKGHDTLITALADVFRDRPGSLLVVGEGPLKADLQAQVVAAGLSGRVHFLGVRHDVWAILPHLDVFVLPSRWEGFPTVILEAMSQRVPVIATDIPGTRELVRHDDTGLLFRVDDPAGLGAAISRLLRDDGWRRALTGRAFNHARQFTLQKMAQCYASKYTEYAG